MASLAHFFCSHLSAENAVDPKQKLDAHRLRYAVYCEERGYEDPDRFSDKLETDEFDDESVHSIIRHKQTAQPLGVVRLVLPNHRKLERHFPIERQFGHVFDQSRLRRFDFSRHNIAEVSRFAISKQSLKNISCVTASQARSCGDEEDDNAQAAKELIPHISLGLIAMLFSVSQKHKISYWYAAMEPSLNRLLTRLGIRFTKIGPLMQYHGKRQPMIARVDDLLENIYRERPDFFELIDILGGTVSFQQRLPVRWVANQEHLTSAH